jgi:adenine-specific DNA-methyltransferase
MQKLDGTSLDLPRENIKALKQLFPEVVTEGKIDFEKLKLVLGEEIETRKEKYEFTWHGKAQSLKLAQTPSMGTLRPDKESSKNWDTTENLYIEGDNLEVLKLLQKSYFGKIKMIYIDPPYNTGKDFVYKDDFQDNIKNYKEVTEQMTKANAETSGRYHTDWLNMMYPRLKLARNLLREDGVIFVHIDEHEVHNLTNIVNEIFGEDNSLGTIVWDKLNPKGDSKTVAVQHESIVCFAKNRDTFIAKGSMQRKKVNAVKMLKKAEELYKKIGEEFLPEDLSKVAKKYELDPDVINKHKSVYDLEAINQEFNSWIKSQENLSGGEAAYSKIDEFGQVYQSVSMAWPNKKKAPDDYFVPLIHPVTGKPCPVPDRGWRNPSATMKKLLENGEIVFGADETTQPRRKYLLKNNLSENVPSVLSFGGSDDSYLKGLEIVFDNPKPYKFAMQLLSFVTKDDDIILDFFSGSATTAHAVMQLNSEDGGNRRFILVQLPELIDEKSEAYKAGFKNICEIGKERIRRVGDKIVEETGKTDLDIGFKVFTLDSSNVKPWDPDFENLEQTLFDLQDNIKTGRTKEDLLYEILLKIGIPLTTQIEEINCNGKTLYNVAYGSVLLCLENEINLDIVNEIIKYKSDVMDTKVIFKESGFLNDSVKTNAIQTLKKNGIMDVRSV